MVDRASRDRMAEAIRSYMDDRITAFELDDVINDVVSADMTVETTRHDLWFCYDDNKDHLVVASKR
jgi:hypothetical protein